MNWPGLDEFREARRGLAVLAAVLFAAALAFPMWHIHIQAVQYPEMVMHLQVYAYPAITGDFVEVARLNHYVGFYYPDPVYWQPNYPPEPNAIDVPEWSLGPFAFIAVSLLSVFVAVAPTTAKLKRGLTAQFGGSVLVFGIMLVDIQYRLYQAGHSLDPNAPMIGVEGFTPPIWGGYQVANITSYSHFGSGAFMAGFAIVLLAIAFYYRDEPVALTALPGRASARLRSVAGRVRGADPATDDNTEA